MLGFCLTCGKIEEVTGRYGSRPACETKQEERRMICKMEMCKEAAVAGGEGLCERHADDLRRSRAFWTAGKLTLDPMDPGRAQLGLAGSRMELPNREQR